MMDSYAHQNIVVNDGNMMPFMPNQIYVVPEPLPLNMHSTENFPKNNDCAESGPSFSKTINKEGFTFFQMVWNSKDSEFDSRISNYMAISENILTDQNESFAKNATNSLPHTYEIDDTDEEDVVFVKAYPIENNETHNRAETAKKDIAANRNENPRRNPSRQARNRKYGRKSNDENIYEEDFCILDSSEEEASADESVPKSSSTVDEEAQNLSVKDMKKWPVNGLHERPEYNTVTQKIEKFDYTIREIQGAVKKPKRDETKKPKPRKKAPAKKYTPKQRKAKSPTSKEEESKVNLDVLKDLINVNYNNLSSFLKHVKSRSNEAAHSCHSIIISPKNDENSSAASNSDELHKNCLKNYQSLMSNQSRLFALVNNTRYRDAFSDLVENSEKNS